jgi:hypothetical protein
MTTSKKSWTSAWLVGPTTSACSQCLWIDVQPRVVLNIDVHEVQLRLGQAETVMLGDAHDREG